MKDPVDWCKYFADIEADPAAITPQITVRQFYQSQEHLTGCDTCANRVDRVLAKIPREKFPRREMN